MRFLSNGDFNFPFEWLTYWAKHFYIWSFQSGTPNPDGLIRLPGRIFNFIVFGLFGHIGASYFYLFSSLAIAFVAFYYFSRHFLEVKNKSILLLGALFFAFNPIFLGNLSKVGLVLAAAMLPLCLLAIQAAFKHRKFRYFLLYILCLNISFLHPYTFTVNLAVSGGYLLYMMWQNRAFVFDNLHKFVLVGIAGVLLNLYFVLPMYSMGTVSKDIISANVTPTQVDYTALVGVSNTGNFFTGFSLSKNVFKDFEFYNHAYQNIYFFGIFVFYVIILWLFLRVEKDLKPSDKRRLGLLFGSFLALIALAATTVMHVDVLIKFLIGMPGGWAFRSPLKWQLYIPLVLFGIMVVLLTHVPKRRQLLLAQVALIGTFILMNSYLGFDVYRKILVPRNLDTFAALENMNLDQKTVLYINSGDCMDYMRANPRVNTELLQVFTSKNTQLKHVLVDNIDSVNMGSYDYLLDCKNSLQGKLAQYDFNESKNFKGGIFRLYANEKGQQHIFTPPYVYGTDGVGAVGPQYDFVSHSLRQPFEFADTETTKAPVTALQDIFEKLRPSDISGTTVRASVTAKPGKGRTLHTRQASGPLFYSVGENKLDFSTTPKPGMQPMLASKDSSASGIPVPGTKDIQVAYEDTSFDYKNILKNPSFEKGLWQQKVTDCYNYDNNPNIGMKLSQEPGTDGKQSLQLEAQSHIACTGPDAISVKAGEHYLLSFDYQSLDGKYAGYNASFDNPEKSSSIVRMQNETEKWQSFSREITVPEGAQTMQIKLYAYPHTYGERTSVVRYDNSSLIKIPAAANRFYVTNQTKSTVTPPKKYTYSVINPTKKKVHVQGASGPFYLASSETYNPMWHLELAGKSPSWWPFTDRKTIPAADHIRLNNTMNAWYVEPTKICGSSASCTKNADGSYDMEFVMEFMPQRWFYAGAIISGLTALVCVIFFVRSTRRDSEEGIGWKLWKR